jgi:hypothetical protein
MDPNNEVSDPVSMTDVVERIEQAAFGRIRDLKVCHDRGQLVLEGFARCFHDKQRAQEAAFSATNAVGPRSTFSNHRLLDRR